MVRIKGIAKFREKLPGFQGPKIFIIPLYALVVLGGLLLALRACYRVPTPQLPLLGALFPLMGWAAIELVAIVAVYYIFTRRDQIKQKYPETCYQRALFIGLVGIEALIFLAFASFYPMHTANASFWELAPQSSWVQPLTTIIGLDGLGWAIPRWVIGIGFLVVGIATILRSLLTFGFDYMAVVYLYYPEESEVQDHEIYSILRHPTYAGLVYIVLGAAISYFSLFHMMLFGLYLGGFYLHVHLVEEQELIRRFGDSYIDYRRKVPPFFVHFKNWKKFFFFLSHISQ